MKKFKYAHAALAAALVGLVIGTFAFRNLDSSADEGYRRELFNARIREGAGSEVRLASKRSTPDEVRASVESAALFIRNRSGLELEPSVLERLARLESAALADKTKRIKAEALARIMTSGGFSRIERMTDDEIARAVEAMRGFDAADLPDSFKRSRDTINLRASEDTDITPQELSNQFKALKDKHAQTVARMPAESFFQSEIDARLRALASALPEKWGRHWDFQTQRPRKALTPVRALLLAYSVASDDMMCDSGENLRKSMTRLHEKIIETTGAYPPPEGRFAYGENGYLFSSPLQTLFDSAAQNDLLDKLEERGSRR